MAVRGFVEYLGSQSVSGWAYDSMRPSGRLEIVVRIADEFVASGYADMHRADLLAAGIGDGGHGFSIDLTEAALSAENAGSLDVYAISGVEIVKILRVQATGGAITDLTPEPSDPIQDDSQFPVFVLGPARSGTSAITLALLESGSFVGCGEGHLLSLAHALLATVDHHYQRGGNDPSTALGRVSIDAFQKLIRRTFVKLLPELYSTKRWLDKTPTVEMVRASLLMQELWPNARFIFMKRRVIENVLSRRRKFPEDTTENHYSDWAAVMTAWLAVREKLGDAALEIEHRQLVLDPDAVATSIGGFLQIPDADAARLRRYLTKNRPEQTDENFGATYSLDRLELDENDARRLTTVCDPLMYALGYSYDETYFSHGNGLRAAKSA
jgi:hypothetical protein